MFARRIKLLPKRNFILLPKITQQKYKDKYIPALIFIRILIKMRNKVHWKPHFISRKTHEISDKKTKYGSFPYGEPLLRFWEEQMIIKHLEEAGVEINKPGNQPKKP